MTDDESEIRRIMRESEVPRDVAEQMLPHEKAIREIYNAYLERSRAEYAAKQKQ